MNYQEIQNIKFRFNYYLGWDDTTINKMPIHEVKQKDKKLKEKIEENNKLSNFSCPLFGGKR